MRPNHLSEFTFIGNTQCRIFESQEGIRTGKLKSYMTKKDKTIAKSILDHICLG